MLCPESTLRTIIELRRQNTPYRRICDELNRAHVPTPAGGSTWHPSYPYRLMGTRGAQDIMGAHLS